jgi:hypothetical protein
VNNAAWDSLDRKRTPAMWVLTPASIPPNDCLRGLT